MKKDVKEVDIIKLQKTLDVMDYVKSTEYVSADEAAGAEGEVAGDGQDAG